MSVKIYPNLKTTPFKVVIPYLDTSITFHFATERHMKKFVDDKDKSRKAMQTRLLNRYHINIRCDMLADIYLYKVVETYGFYMVDGEGEVYRWPQEVILNGAKLMKDYCAAQ